MATLGAGKNSFSYTGSVVTETVATTGTYDIIAYGGQGGAGAGGKGAGGRGAKEGGYFSLAAGQTINIVVGGAGGDNEDALVGGGGGGGGSFVSSGTGQYLVVAGGGGGGYSNSSIPSNSIALAGGSGTTGNSIGGGGSGGQGFDGGGGGGGEQNAGKNGKNGTGSRYGHGGAAGGYGGSGSGGGGVAGAVGGFGGGGGGGGGGDGGGGGGGSFGGSGGGEQSSSSGGGSYDASTSHAIAINGENLGNGKVEIDFVSDVVCFLAGTQIGVPVGNRRVAGVTTLRNEVPVETIAPGDKVMTASGVARRVVWVGNRRLLARPGQRNRSTPVIIRKGAFADNVPNADLRVTQGHSFHLDGVLVPVEFLVNHRSIVWDDHANEPTVYNIELEAHDVLLANGAPAESYRDDGNRWMFDNGPNGWGLPPQAPCAPVHTGGPMVDTIWRRLLDRAELLTAGPRAALPLTEAAHLHLLVDGKSCFPAICTSTACTFRLSAPPQSVRIISRVTVPQELGLSRDPRLLGVPLRQIVVSQGRRVQLLDSIDLHTDDYHAYERDNAIRWTKGDAAVPMQVFDGFDGPLEITLHLNGKTRYRDDIELRRAS